MSEAVKGACPLPLAASVADTPFGMVADMQRKEIERACGLDLARCNVCTIVIALDEFDHKRIDALGHRFETWPETVRALMQREWDGFKARNADGRIEAVTTAIGGEPKCFILCLHWRPKTAGAAS